MSPQRQAPPELLEGSDVRRVEYFATLCDALWPETKPLDRRSASNAARQVQDEYLVIPNARMPRLLVPSRPRVAGAAAVRRYSEPGSATAWLKRNAVAVAIRTGIGEVVLSDRLSIPREDAASNEAPTIEEYLRQHLGDIVVSIHVGPARANRKPVLQVLDRRGRTLGFAKLSVNELTRALVRHESSTLSFLSAQALSNVCVPHVIHHGTWRDHEVLVQSALPVWRRRGRPTATKRQAAMLDVAAVTGTTEAALEDSAYMSRLSERASSLNTDTTGEVLRIACKQLLQRAGDAMLKFGAWHGDWSPWNMAFLRDQLLVWDWERFGEDVPLGFDAIHFRLQESVVRKRIPPTEAVEQTLKAAAADIRPFAVTADAAEITALLYLTDIAVRYAQDGQAEAGARLGVLGRWLLPVLSERVSRL